MCSLHRDSCSYATFHLCEYHAEKDMNSAAVNDAEVGLFGVRIDRPMTDPAQGGTIDDVTVRLV